MTALGIEPELQKWYVQSTLNPASRLSHHQLQAFSQYASPEEMERLQRAVGHQ